MDSNNQKDNIGLVADLISIGTFIISLFDIAIPNFSLVEIPLGEGYSPSRLLLAGLIVYSTTYFSTNRFVQKVSRYDSDVNSGLFLDALISLFTGWVYSYTLNRVLSYEGAQSGTFFSIAYFLSVVLYYSFYYNNYQRIQSEGHNKRAVLPLSSLIIFYSFWLMMGKDFSLIYIIPFTFAFFILGSAVFASRGYG